MLNGPEPALGTLYLKINTIVIVIITNVIELAYSITIVNKFADRLRYARQLRGLTQASLAKACGLSQGAIANYEGKNRQTAKEIFKLADALLVNPLWLSQGTGPMERVAPTAVAPSGNQVSDTVPASWPFGSIPPEHFWTLSGSQRELIEKTVATLITSLRAP